MTMAEFFMILPQGPNCWMGLGAFSDRVLLLDRWIKYRKRRKKQNRRRRQINKQVSHTYLIFSYFVSALCTFRFAVLWCHGPFGRTAQSRKKNHHQNNRRKSSLAQDACCCDLGVHERERNPSRYETNSKQSAQRWCRWVCQTNTHILFLSLLKNKPTFQIQIFVQILK